MNEILVQGLIDSRHIVKYIDSFVDSNATLNIVMEYCSRGDLNSYLLNRNGSLLSENRIWKIFIEILLGLDALHSKGYLH